MDHDLRRSFGALMAQLNVPEGIRRRFLNRAHPNVTALYNESEWSDLRIWTEKIEQHMFAKAPNVYNSLKLNQWPMLEAPAPFVCKIVKRMGRPRKQSSNDFDLLAA